MDQMKDDNNLDNHCEDSIFSVTEEAQYPLFDGDKAKREIKQKKREFTNTIKSLEAQQPQQSMSFHMNGIVPSFGSPPLKFADSFEAEIKIDEPLVTKQESKETNMFSAINRPNFTHSLGLDQMNIPQLFNRGRVMNVHRPKPQVASRPAKTSPIQGADKDEVSPRSKMLASLKAKVNSFSSNGSFKKYTPLPSRTHSATYSSDTHVAQAEKLTPFRPQPQKSQVEERKFRVATPPPKNDNKTTKHPSEPKEESKKEESDKTKNALSSRKDVVYKTLLRSVKRHYSNEFESKTEYATLSKSKQEKR